MFVAGKQIEILHCEDCWLWVGDVIDVPVGATCTQVKFTGSLEDFFREFHGTWSARWQRHAAIPESQWYDILAFARQFARPVPCQSIPLTPDILSNEIKRKKRGTARGLDGVSLQDLKHLPPNALDNMLDKPLHILPPC